MYEFYNDYPLAPDKIEIKIEMMSNYQIKIVNLCNVCIGYVKNKILWG